MGSHARALLPQRDISCGGHVHVTPVSRHNKFSLRTLKKIAFASVACEDFVSDVLPPARRENQYCTPNSRGEGSGLRDALTWGKTTAGLQTVARHLRAVKTEAELVAYMQATRYVLWNFQNLVPNPKTGRCTGTVEFRGGSQFLSTRGTLAWVAFVLGFVTLAADEDLLHRPGEYVHPSSAAYEEKMLAWWKRLRAAAKKSKMGRHLPEDYKKMHTR